MDQCQVYFEGRANRIPDSFFLPGLTGSETAIQRRSSQVAHTHRSLSRAEDGGRGGRKVPGARAVSGGGEGRMGRILLQQVTNQPQAAGR